MKKLPASLHAQLIVASTLENQSCIYASRKQEEELEAAGYVLRVSYGASFSFNRLILTTLAKEYLKNNEYKLTPTEQKILKEGSGHKFSQVYGRYANLLILMALGYVAPPNTSAHIHHTITEKGREWVAAHL